MAEAVRFSHASPVTASSIFERQNGATALRAACAFRRRYVLAKRWRALRLVVAALLGTGGVVLALLQPATADYVAATAAGWIVVSRVFIEPQERREQEQGALAQEAFDVEVLELPWNATAAGPRPEPEDLRNWGHRCSPDGVRNWYADTRPARAPVDALICQRSSLTWARQDHQTYARVLRAGAVGTWVVSIVIAVVLQLSVGEYLLRLGLPILPALLDVWDIATANETLGRRRASIAGEANRLYTRAREAGVPPSVHDCRRLQDEIFSSRRVMQVPEWFYRLTRERRQQNMAEVVHEQVEELPRALQEAAPD